MYAWRLTGGRSSAHRPWTPECRARNSLRSVAESLRSQDGEVLGSSARHVVREFEVTLGLPTADTASCSRVIGPIV